MGGRVDGQTVGVMSTRGVVRRATPGDLEALTELDVVVRAGRAKSPTLERRVESDEVLLCELDDRVVGYAVVRARSFFDCDFVESLVVGTDDRRRGVGDLLLLNAVGHSATRRIFTSTNQSNAAMINLLRRQGWHFSGRLEGVDEGDPELVYFIDVR